MPTGGPGMGQADDRSRPRSLPCRCPSKVEFYLPLPENAGEKWVVLLVRLEGTTQMDAKVRVCV